MKSFNKIIYWYAVIALTVPNVALCFTEHLSTWAALANIVLPFGVYMALMSISRKPGKMVWWLFPIIFFAAFQIVLLYLFGKGVIAVDMFLNLVTTNPGEAMELLDNLIPGVASVFILYLPLLILGVVSIRSKKAPVLSNGFRKRCRQWAAGIAVVGCGCMAMSYLSDTQHDKGEHDVTSDDHHAPHYSVLNDLYPVNVFYNLYLAVKRNNASIHYKEASARFRFEAQATHPEDSCEVYVMVIGETARAMNFSLYGYQRDTNPRLSKTPGLVTFSDVTTQSNTTHKSVPMLLSLASASNFERLFHEKGILQAFREAGFHTVFLSNQRPNHSFIDFLGEQADQWLFLKTGDANQAGRELAEAPGKDGNYYDADLLPILDRILARKRKKEFIVLHTYGSHFNYMDRYPRQMAHFLPDTHCEAKKENRPDLINAYDNTIRYTDLVLSGVIERLRAHGGMSAMLYTSDHGENIFDDSHKLFLHASPRASEYELHVPFLVWTSQSFQHQEPAVAQALSANRHKQAQSSRSAFHTMLQIGGVSTRFRQDHESLASPAYRPTPLLYLNDHNEAIPQAECGF
nr:phosphoethanolamine transferase [Prevotella sp.]